MRVGGPTTNYANSSAASATVAHAETQYHSVTLAWPLLPCANGLQASKDKRELAAMSSFDVVNQFIKTSWPDEQPVGIAANRRLAG